MKTFALVHRNVCLNVICDDEFENVIKEHFCKSTKLIFENSKSPTYTLCVTAQIRTIDGIYHKMVDKWFNYSTLDCWIDNSKRICYISNFKADCIANRNLTIQYFTSNLFNRLLVMNGYVGIHSSCVEKDGDGVMFVGSRLAGKTTCMLDLLNNGFNFVNNDTAAIKYIESEHQIEALGIIKNVFIRMNKSFATQIQNQKYLEIAERQGVQYSDRVSLEENRIILTPLELAELNNCKFIPSVKIKIVIIPQYNPRLNSIRFSLQASKAYAQFFISQSLPLVHDTTAFLTDIAVDDLGFYQLQNGVEYLSSLPCYVCEYNERNIEHLAETVQNALIR